MVGAWYLAEYRGACHVRDCVLRHEEVVDAPASVVGAGTHDRICIDPGPGFDKFADEDVVIQRATRSMVSMGYPLLCAVSRKRFVGAVSGVADANARDAATQGVCIAAIENGARILRVHADPPLPSRWLGEPRGR